jgi:hypothetical protein
MKCVADRVRVFVFLGLAVGAFVLAAGGSAGTEAAACFFTKKCRYDIEVEFVARTANWATVRINARFPRLVVVHTQNPPPPTAIKQSIGMNGGDHLRTLGTIEANLRITQPGCLHTRRYVEKARMEFLSTIPLRVPGQRSLPAGLGVEFATPKVIPPQWSDTCPYFRDLNRPLRDMIAHGAFFTGPGWKSSIFTGGNDFLGADSLAGSYSLDTLKPQKEKSLIAPFRQLWEGRSVVIRQRTQKTVFSGRPTVYELRITFTRR